MAQRVGLLNGTNLNQDKDIGTLLDVLTNATGFILNGGLAVTTNTVAIGKCLIACTRTSTTPNEDVWVVFENTTAVTIDTSGTKKVWVEITQANINDGSANALGGTGIGAITTGANYPAGNYIPLAVITGGSIVDDRPTTTLGSHVVNGLLKLSQGANIASATTTDLSTATGNTLTITGTTTISSFGTLPAGTKMTLIFNGVLTLTYNAVSLILPTGANLTTAVGDCMDIESLGSGNWKCTGYQKADGSAVLTVTPNIPSNQITLVAGENISIGNAVYVYTVDGKAYRTDATQLAKMNFLWFANSTVTTGQNLVVNINGVDSNQSGLAIDTKYFLGTQSYTINERKQLAQASTYMMVDSTTYTTNGKTICQSFTLDQTIVVSQLAMAFTQSGGSVNWWSIIRVETDSAGAPSGTLVNANSFMSVTNGGTVQFPWNFTLTKNTKYWITVYADYYASNPMYIKNVLYTAGNVLAGETMGYYNNTAYNNFTRSGSLQTISPGTLYYTFTVVSFPEIGNASALTTASNTSDTFTGWYGIISSTAGVTPNFFATPVGTAISTTKILIDSLSRVKNDALTTPTVGASPYTYTNITNKPCIVSITGGTVSAVAISRDNSTFYQTAAATNTFVVLGVGDYVKVTYSVTPTLKVFTL